MPASTEVAFATSGEQPSPPCSESKGVPGAGMTTVWVMGADWLPAASTATTLTVWVPPSFGTFGAPGVAVCDEANGSNGTDVQVIVSTQTW